VTRPELTDREFRLFSEWLSEEYGLCFGPAKRDILRSRLDARRVALGMDSYEELYFHLKFHPEREEEKRRLLPHLTNNESYFFREQAQLDALRDRVLREVKGSLAGTGREEVRILSAGSASGEEPYTLAMVARDSGELRPPWKVRITGVDLDPEALARAHAAEYGPNAFRRLHEAVRDRNFEPAGPERWRLKRPIRSMVSFAQANLVSSGWWQSLPRQDVVFCRNVLIYFDQASITRAIEGLYDCLVPGGYLFLGHAETLSRVRTRFEPVRHPGVIYYRRPADG
jgi:chemotaxis protein methyltransferase CheR